AALAPLVGAHEPSDLRLRPRLLLVTEPGHHADRVPGNAHLARAAPQITGSGEAVQEQARRFRDPRGLLREAQVRKDEEPPVRCHVLRPVQFECGRARVYPLPRWMLSPQDLCGPPFPPDFPLGADDRRIVGRTVEKIPQNPETDARVRILREEPVAESAAQGHPHLGTGGPYLSPPGGSSPLRQMR